MYYYVLIFGVLAWIAAVAATMRHYSLQNRRARYDQLRLIRNLVRSYTR